MELGLGEGVRIFQLSNFDFEQDTLLHIVMVKYEGKGGLVHT